MMNNKYKRGFTLIELLVVIAIIGILASVVLASLNTARDKGTDAAIQSSLKNATAQAQVWYVSNSRSYDGVCALTGANNIGSMVASADVKFDGTAPIYADGTAASATGGACHDSANSGTTRSAWVAAVPLKGGGYWCVDSTGTSKKVTTALAANALVCPAS